MRVAALDLGSNTSLLLVAEMEGSSLKRVLHDETTVTRMGQEVHATRRLHTEALDRLEKCFASYQQTIQQLKCDKVIAVATSAARDVENGEALLKLGTRYDIPIHIIAGEREAQLTFQGALADRKEIEGCAVIDVGGGSTEIIAMSESQGRAVGTSVDVGSVRLTELFVSQHPIPMQALKEVRRYTEEAFYKAQLPRTTIGEIVAVAGTPTTLAALDQEQAYSEERVNGYKLTCDRIDMWIRKLAGMTVLQREGLPGMQPKRADVIVTGAIILNAAIRALNKNEITVSTRGVRYGVAMAWQEFK